MEREKTYFRAEQLHIEEYRDENQVVVENEKKEYMSGDLDVFELRCRRDEPSQCLLMEDNGKDRIVCWRQKKQLK